MFRHFMFKRFNFKTYNKCSKCNLSALTQAHNIFATRCSVDNNVVRSQPRNSLFKCQVATVVIENIVCLEPNALMHGTVYFSSVQRRRRGLQSFFSLSASVIFFFNDGCEIPFS